MFKRFLCATFMTMCFSIAGVAQAEQQEGKLESLTFDEFKTAVVSFASVESQIGMCIKGQEETGRRLIDDLDYQKIFADLRSHYKRQALCSGISADRVEDVISHPDKFSDDMTRFLLKMNQKSFSEVNSIESGYFSKLRQNCPALSSMMRQSQELYEKEKGYTCPSATKAPNEEPTTRPSLNTEDNAEVDTQKMDAIIERHFAKDIQEILRVQDKINLCISFVRDSHPDELTLNDVEGADKFVEAYKERMKNKANCRGVSASYFNEWLEPEEDGVEGAEAIGREYFASKSDSSERRNAVTRNCKKLFVQTNAAWREMKKGQGALNSKTCEYPQLIVNY